MLAIISFSFMAIGSGSDDDEVSKVGEVTQTDGDGTAATDEAGKTETDSDSDDKSETNAVTTDKTEYKVGETLVTKQIKVTYLSSGEYLSDNQFIQPTDGNKFVYIRLYCENISDSDQNISYYDFECYADGYSCKGCYSMEDNLSATMSAGRTATGTVCFEVPQDAGQIEFEFEENAWTSEKYKFLYEGINDSGIVPEKKAEASSEVYKAGDIVESKTERITYLSCGEYQSDNMFIQPKDGNKYIYLEFEFENLSSSDDNISYLYFECYADGEACESHYFDDNELSGTLSQGRKTKGRVYFEVPVSASVIEVEYSSSFWSSNKIIFSFS